MCTDACNCSGCCNEHEHDPLRQQAIATTLERNKYAFRPKVTVNDTLLPMVAAHADTRGSIDEVRRLTARSRHSC